MSDYIDRNKMMNLIRRLGLDNYSINRRCIHEFVMDVCGADGFLLEEEFDAQDDLSGRYQYTRLSILHGKEEKMDKLYKVLDALEM